MHAVSCRAWKFSLQRKQFDNNWATILQILDLIPQADKVTKLGAECSYCRTAGHPRAAHFTLRIAADSRQEVVGGADKYAPVCRQHYNELSGIREQAASASA